MLAAYFLPVMFGDEMSCFVVVCDIFGTGRVRMTPALVPIHNRSLHARRHVMRRQAVLCCRIMSSEPGEENMRETYKIVSDVYRKEMDRNVRLSSGHLGVIIFKDTC